jgi:hypothetical protein
LRQAACWTNTVQRAPQVNYSARILWQDLRAQRGFDGS